MNFESFTAQIAATWQSSAIRQRMLEARTDILRNPSFTENTVVLSIARQFAHTEFVQRNFQMQKKYQQKRSNETNMNNEEQEEDNRN